MPISKHTRKRKVRRHQHRTSGACVNRIHTGTPKVFKMQFLERLVRARAKHKKA